MFASGSDRIEVRQNGRRGGGAAELSVARASVAAMTAIATFSVVAIDCREPRKVAEFYSAVLGVPIAREEPDWVQLAEGAPLAFQLAPDHVPPQWPSAEHPQQMHLDLDVTDLDAAEEAVLALGARKHEHQPGKTFRVFLDPAGHPFCLCQV
jgi:catechol 2,3-dioxygenase-like lactoylglutathione lyase family enzyme